MGNTANAVPQRLARDEPIDVVLMVGYALDDLTRQGKVVPDSRVGLARSVIGAAVRTGAPHPDIGTRDALRQALLNAKSVAYSDSASGVYIEREMFKRLGIAERMAGKARMVPADPVGEVVARGEAELGFQQISELKPVHGIDLLGPHRHVAEQGAERRPVVALGSQPAPARRAGPRALARGGHPQRDHLGLQRRREPLRLVQPQPEIGQADSLAALDAGQLRFGDNARVPLRNKRHPPHQLRPPTVLAP